jgi:tripartite-type tricarboxylate transporter receptor subunit TctC
MLMKSRTALTGCLALALAGWPVPTPTHAQSFPSSAIRIVVPTPPGTPPDIISRVVAARLSERDGWRMVVENRPGALQTVGMLDVLKQPADGYTLYAMSVPTAAVPALMPQLGVHPEVDFTPVVKLSTSYNVLVVPPGFPAATMPEFIALVKARPGQFNFSSAGFGTPAHLAAELFRLETGVHAIHVPYQQPQQRVADLLTGINHFDFLASVTAGDLIATGKLRGIAVTAPSRVAGLPNVPTVVEQGFPGLVVEDYVGFAVRSGTPETVVRRLNEAVNQVLREPKVRDAFEKLGAAPAGGSQTDFNDFIRSQVAHWSRVIRESGIKLPQ